jgi:hypothetical protein
VSRDEALRTIAERYFVSHGPASLRDFAGWTGLTVADAKTALALAQPLLRRIVVDDVELWMSGQPMEVDWLEAPDQCAHLLPGFDELMLGYKERSASLPTRHADRIVPGANGMFLSTLVLDGVVRGTWRRSTRAKSVVLEASPFTRLTTAQKRAFGAPAERYATYLATDVTLTWKAQFAP